MKKFILLTILMTSFSFLCFAQQQSEETKNYYRDLFRNIVPIRTIFNCNSSGPCLDRSFSFNTTNIDINSLKISVTLCEDYGDHYSDRYRQLGTSINLTDEQGIKLQLFALSNEEKLILKNFKGFFLKTTDGNALPLDYLADNQRIRNKEYLTNVAHVRNVWNGNPIYGGYVKNIALLRDMDYILGNNSITFLSSSEILTPFKECNGGRCYNFVIKVAYRLNGERAGYMQFVSRLPDKGNIDSLFTYDAVNTLYNLNNLLSSYKVNRENNIIRDITFNIKNYSGGSLIFKQPIDLNAIDFYLKQGPINRLYTPCSGFCPPGHEEWPLPVMPAEYYKKQI